MNRSLTPVATRASGQHQLIKSASVGQFVTLGKVVPVGALQCRRLGNGADLLYWRYTMEGKTARVSIGPYDASLPPKSLSPVNGRYSLAAAQRAAEDLASRHFAAREEGGHRAIVEQARAAKAVAKLEKAQAQKHTLMALLEAYCSHLQALGRESYKDAQGIFRLHVIETWPEVANMPALEVTEEHITDMLRSLYEADKGRTANKLRAYLRAAYEVARRARTDPSVPIAFKGFCIRVNPAAATAANSHANRADKNPLDVEQLTRYWLEIKSVSGLKGAALRLHLLTGGQRIAQFVRLKMADIRHDRITLYDAKGRPGRGPRAHVLPLIEAAAAEIQALASKGEFAISLDGGATSLWPETLSGWAREIAEDLPIKEFAAKRIRSGVETLLAAAGVSRDIRGRLQSHGLGGIQDTHYDAHDYLPEKRRALETLYALLNQAPTPNIVPQKED